MQIFDIMTQAFLVYWRKSLCKGGGIMRRIDEELRKDYDFPHLML